jgi:capsular polysaccharide biosynthesis protein
MSVESKSSDARALASEFEPLPRIGLLQSARRYWYLVLLPVVVFVPVAIVAALSRTPTYTAEARLMVGRLNISTPGAVSGFAQAAQDLAATYPLVINADGVIDPVAKQLHTTPGAIRNALSATQVPGSAIVRVDATGSSSKDAMNVANASSASLVTFLTNFNRDNPDATRLLKQLHSAEVSLQAADAALSPNTKRPLGPRDQKLAAELATQKAVVSAASGNYQTTQLTEAVSSLLQPLTSAHSATSDRSSKLEIAVFAALIAGLAVGLGLATLQANRVARLALTAPTWEPERRSERSGGSGKPRRSSLRKRFRRSRF